MKTTDCMKYRRELKNVMKAFNFKIVETDHSNVWTSWSTFELTSKTHEDYSILVTVGVNNGGSMGGSGVVSMALNWRNEEDSAVLAEFEGKYANTVEYEKIMKRELIECIGLIESHYWN